MTTYQALPASLPAGHEPSATELQGIIDEIRRRGILARGRRTTSSTAIGVLRLDNIAIYSGRAYKVWTSGINFLSTVLTDSADIFVTYRTDGTSAGTGDTVLGGASARATLHSANDTPILPISAPLYPSADGTLSVLLCVQRIAGSGTVTVFGASTQYTIDLVVEDIGPAPTDTGVII